ncbi:MAG: UvrD-helicase domain-containing protein [Phyllobacteriaceae bacterium]|nr:UvrD-helicase domain-containing protein [Phyllobacteriaceae bacterium]
MSGAGTTEGNRKDPHLDVKNIAARAPQLRAGDPSRLVWVTANAGSGKTHVLAERVVRLLTEGVDPRAFCA